jgi:hypothetical protein
MISIIYNLLLDIENTLQLFFDLDIAIRFCIAIALGKNKKTALINRAVLVKLCDIF